jgi:hypothetical protein
MPFRRRLLSFALVVRFALAVSAAAQAQKKEANFYGELEPRLYTAPELMSITAFGPISLAEAKQLGVFAEAGDRLYSGEFTLGKDGKGHRVYRAIIIRLPAGNHALYVDANLNGRFDPDERISFLPVTNPNFPKFKEMASFDVDLPHGIFTTCPMEVAVVDEHAEEAVKPPQIAVAFTSTAFVRGFAALPDRRLMVHFEYNFDIGDVNLKQGSEWIDVNNNRTIDMSPASPDLLQANGSAPIFHIGQLTLQVESVNLRRDQFVLRAVPASPPRKHWHFPFQK